MQTVSTAALAVLTADSLTVDCGADLLADDLTVAGDLSPDLQGGKVSWTGAATIHRTCQLLLSADLPWGTALVRPYMLLSDGTSQVRFNTGVFCLTTPEDVIGESPRSWDVQGYDRLYLLGRAVGDSYSVPAGTGVLQAVRQAITDAGLLGILLDGSAEAAVLPSDKTWPLLGESGPTTWLRIVNDLLAQVNYRGAWCDENGLFRSVPYLSPSSRASEFTFTADDPTTTLIGQSRARLQDRWGLPNRWVFVQQNLAGDPPPAPAVGAGLYVIPNTTGELTRTSVVTLDAADQTSLEAQGDRRAANDLRVSTTYKVTTAPFPAAGHYDVFTYVDREVSPVPVGVQASHWELPLLGGDMAWEWEAA